MCRTTAHSCLRLQRCSSYLLQLLFPRSDVQDQQCPRWVEKSCPWETKSSSQIGRIEVLLRLHKVDFKRVSLGWSASLLAMPWRATMRHVSATHTWCVWLNAQKPTHTVVFEWPWVQSQSSSLAPCLIDAYWHRLRAALRWLRYLLCVMGKCWEEEW